MNAARLAELKELADDTYSVATVYVFAADLVCVDCGNEIRKHLAAQGKAPTDWSDENSYDSDDFPKGPYSDGGGEADSVQHCGMGEGCRNAIELPKTGYERRGRLIGAWLGNPLTRDGVDATCEAVQGGGEVAVLWSVWYSEELTSINCLPLKKRVQYDSQGRLVR